MSITLRAVGARVVLTACCVSAFFLGDALRPDSARAMAETCSNGRCDGATLCTFRAGESCAFSDPRTCVTYRCQTTQY